MASLLPFGCDRSNDFSEISPAEVIDTLRATTWFGGRRAACSIGFDDTRLSHMTLAAPALEAFGFRGSFHLVTERVGNWPPWQRMFDAGHEIANHTRSHRRLSDLSPAEAAEEIAGGKHDLMEHIAGLWDVPTFVYPYGDAPAWSRPLVAKEHYCARAGDGIDGPAPNDLLAIKGLGYYHPFDVASMVHDLDAAIACGGWYLPYFHSLTDDSIGTTLECPMAVFTAFLDSLRSREADVWVAPIGVVAAYIREREGFRHEMGPSGGSRLWIEAAEPRLYVVPLTVECTFKRGIDDLLLTLDSETDTIPRGTQSTLIILIPGKMSALSFQVRSSLFERLTHWIRA